jgi:hypothetical protein
MRVNLTTTFKQLKAAGACTEGYKKLATSLGGITKYGAETPISLIQILDSNGVEDCLWSLRAVDHPDRDKIARYIACDCAESVLWIYEKYNATDKRPHKAIRIARLFANGEATEQELKAAWAAAREATGAAARAAAWAAAWAAARAAAWAAAGAAAWEAAKTAAGAAARAAAWAAARAAVREAQTLIIRSYIGIEGGSK